MAQNFPSLADLKNIFLSEYESAIGQEIPVNDKAQSRIDSTVLAFTAMIMQREVLTAIRENLALTASRAGLIKIGNNYELPIKAEVSTVLTATLPAVTDTEIPALTDFTGDDNGVIYYTTEAAVAVAGVATLNLTSRTPGVIGNLAVGKTLSNSRQIPGAELTATITETTTTGADTEDTEVYRQRVLDIIRAPGGGGNSADYRNWSQAVTNVKRTFPYSGRPYGDPIESAPPHRTVYVEVVEEIDADGIAPQTLLDAVKAEIITDPVTLQHREPLGLTEDTLHTASIRRTDIFVKITNPLFQTGTEAQVKSVILTAVTNYFLAIQPFVQGLDFDGDRNDLITALTVSNIVQDVLKANSASAEGIAFGLSVDTFLPSYQMGQGEKAKLGGITYVTL